MTKRLIITLSDVQLEVLDTLMKEDLQHNRSGYIGTLIVQETKRREESKSKRRVGRPSKDEEEDEETLMYPGPYQGAGPYTETELQAYYKDRGEKMPPLPEPLPKK